jgi:hypothetical protein
MPKDAEGVIVSFARMIGNWIKNKKMALVRYECLGTKLHYYYISSVVSHSCAFLNSLRNSPAVNCAQSFSIIQGPEKLLVISLFPFTILLLQAVLQTMKIKILQFSFISFVQVLIVPWQKPVSFILPNFAMKYFL